ncbi:MAG: OsmC family protein [Leptospira sp.]|nr:OsmC family protein [Leptospira sp.]NCS94560.1 OsmC family protein [Leptospira sp.]
MNISLQLKDKPYVLEAKNPDGNRVMMDASPEIGGKKEGVRPTELLLMGIAGCSGIDILAILNKQKQNVESFQVDVQGDKEKVGFTSLFTKIRVMYNFEGELDSSKILRAIELSLGKYCSVSKTIEKVAEISFGFSLNGKVELESKDVASLD